MSKMHWAFFLRYFFFSWRILLLPFPDLYHCIVFQITHAYLILLRNLCIALCFGLNHEQGIWYSSWHSLAIISPEIAGCT